MSAIDEHYAKEAERLLNDDVLAEAMTAVRMNALVELSTVKADDVTEILRLQAIANCLPEVVDALKSHIIAAGGMSGGVDPNQPTSES
jgi:endonuclease V-like protein UPF0215 family